MAHKPGSSDAGAKTSVAEIEWSLQAQAAAQLGGTDVLTSFAMACNSL
jgi:hypothetical protein